METRVGVRELRQQLSKYLDRVKAGENLVVTERGREVARLVPSGPSESYADLAARFGASVPMEPLEAIVARLDRATRAAGTTDAFLAEAREGR